MRCSKVILACILAVSVLSGCSQLVGLLKPGGITANTQLGKENTQQIVGNQKSDELSVSDNTGDTQVVKSEVSVTAKKVDKAMSSSVKSLSSTSSSVVAETVAQVKSSERIQDVTAGPGSSVVVHQNDRYPAWLLLLLVIGWVMPTPVTIMNWVLARFHREPIV